MRCILFSCFLFLSFSLSAQDLVFDIQYKGESLALEKEYNYNGQAVTFSTCKFYVSNIQFGKNKLQNQYHLIDLENPASLKIPVPSTSETFVNVAFNVGVDSTKSVSGVYGSDLDPTNGMYWAWQSGYINCKIEGTSPLCPSRKNKFQFHLGGYSYPNNTLQTVSLDADYDGKNFKIAIALDEFIDHINLSETYEIMSPSTQAVYLSNLFSSSFHYEY